MISVIVPHLNQAEALKRFTRRCFCESWPLWWNRDRRRSRLRRASIPPGLSHTLLCEHDRLSSGAQEPCRASTEMGAAFSARFCANPIATLVVAALDRAQPGLCALAGRMGSSDWLLQSAGGSRPGLAFLGVVLIRLHRSKLMLVLACGANPARLSECWNRISSPCMRIN
jgi:hypothetical protein